MCIALSPVVVWIKLSNGKPVKGLLLARSGVVSLVSPLVHARGGRVVCIEATPVLRGLDPSYWL